MEEKTRYSVRNYDIYDDYCTASINNIDVIYVQENNENEDTIVVEEVNNKVGEGSRNEVSKSHFNSLIEGGYIVKEDV